ncbi:MAG: hypothetical protein IPJ48_17955 [Propionivibrio sp.]|uniref:Uncharacterized protein n=1 Tax=Candidatus Propionivibrio dominans TaxID=2954373 RepID=A0A9D7F9R8_9RHOO|nr:hypothetical protein [Candidatus Propionivibrio dominans]
MDPLAQCIQGDLHSASVAWKRSGIPDYIHQLIELMGFLGEKKRTEMLSFTLNAYSMTRFRHCTTRNAFMASRPAHPTDHEFSFRDRVRFSQKKPQSCLLVRSASPEKQGRAWGIC